jgi:hypothetical protein
MNLNACSRTVQISRIDFTDFSYAISPDCDIISDETFKNSIARHGILHPPITRETASGSYVIVTGRKRLVALRSLYPETSACCCLLIPREVPDIDVYSALLEDMQSLMLLELEKPIIRAIHGGLLHESVARDLSPLPAAGRMALFHIITSLRLSVSYQKKLVTACREIAIREEKNIAELLENREVSSILNHPGANPPQKTKNLMTWLTRRHMPRSSQAEAEFAAFVAAMQLPDKVTIQHTSFFEDDAVTLSVTFADRKSLQDAWEGIKNAIHKKND